MNISIDRETKKLTIEVDVSMLSEDHSRMKTSSSFSKIGFDGDPEYRGFVTIEAAYYPGEDDNEH